MVEDTMVEESPEAIEGEYQGIRIRKEHLQAFLLTTALVLVVLLFASMQNDADEADGITPIASDGGETRASEEDDPCIGCHDDDIMPGITADWRGSKHAEEDVSCIDCHEGEESDPDTEEHNGYWVTSVVTPLDCAECHPDAVEENDRSLHSLGADYYALLFDGKKLPYLESQIDDGYIMRDGVEMDHAATIRGCQSCHGTDMTGETVDNWTVWPNNGIGRINPDGSKGSCSACHSRHSFSLKEARSPETCGQCHMGPDHPQIEIYSESKHGNIYAAEGDTWNWEEEDWKAGEDYRAPTCAGCHMSSAPGIPATHDVSSRLSWELEPAISRHTDNTANTLGVEISDGSTWQVKRDRMKTVCEQCHGETWVDNYYEQADLAIELYNQQYTDAKKIVDALYADELLTPEAFDEVIEFKIYEMWHHEGRRARMGAFMMGPDYTQWHGFYEVFQDRIDIEEMNHTIRAAAAGENGGNEHEDGDDDDEVEWIAWTIPFIFLLGFVILAVAVTRK